MLTTETMIAKANCTAMISADSVYQKSKPGMEPNLELLNLSFSVSLFSRLPQARGTRAPLFEFHDHLAGGQAVAGAGVDGGDDAVVNRPDGIFHFHGLDDGELVAGLDRLARNRP